MSGKAPRFSLIIPAYNEEGYLPRLLDTVEVARERYGGGPEAIEVVVVDNLSTDRTGEVARALGCRVVRVEKRVIAAARNGGAHAARGEVLAFVDADSRIHPETFNAIDRALATGRVIGGATGVKLERLSLGLAVTYALMVAFVWITGLDAGVVFCRRDDFAQVGGYNEERLYAEDVEFLLQLRRLGKTRGQKLVRLTWVKAVASTRKFDKHGDWHYVTMMFAEVLPRLVMGRAPGDFERTYWYEDR